MRLPSDAELVAYLDGELDPARKIEIERLTEISPQVRERMADIRRDMLVCQHVVTASTPQTPSTDELWESFRLRLDLDPIYSAPPSSLTDPVSAPPQARIPAARVLALAAAASLLMVVALWRFTPSTVSASTLLTRARQAETAQLDSVKAPVVQRRLRVVRTRVSSSKPETAMLTSWFARASGQSKERLESPAGADRAVASLWSELNMVLSRNGMDRRELLSPAAYQRWRENVPADGERVTRERWDDGFDVYLIETTLKPRSGDGMILRSDFVVRAADWQPVSNRIHVRMPEGETIYDIRSIDYTVVARASLPPSYFDVALPPRPVATHRAPVRVEPLVLAEKPLVVEVPVSIDAQIVAMYAVHRSGACDGDPVEVLRLPSGETGVRGTVSTVERRDQLLVSLSGKPGIVLDLRVDERAGVPRRVTAAPLHQVLARAKAGRNRAEIEALELSLDSFLTLIASDADALRMIGSRYTEEQLTALTSASREHLREMMRDHLTALDGNMRHVAALLDGVPASKTSAEAAAAVEGKWPEAVRSLADDIRRLSDWNSLAGDPEPAQALRSLVASYRQLSARAVKTRQLVMAVLPGAEDPSVAARAR